MNFRNLLWGAAEFAVFFPGMLLCLLPVRKWLRRPARYVFPITFVFFALLCFAGSYWEMQGLKDGNLFMLAVIACCLPLYFYMVRLDKLKLLYIFLCSVAVLSFGGLANHIVQSFFEPTGHSVGEYSSWGLLAQWIYSLAALAAYRVFYHKKLVWLLTNFQLRSVWGAAGLVPLLCSFCNWMMVPRDYATMSVGRVMKISWIMWGTFLTLFVTLIALFYAIARSIVDKYDAEYKMQLAQMQRSQYEAMQNYFMQTSRLRHDFRHTVRTISELAESGQYEELISYLRDYTQEEALQHPQRMFCRHPAANALLQYYVTRAEHAEIATHLQIALPAQLAVSDVDLCAVLGNLLENAIHACEGLSPPKREIRLSADIDADGALYIVMLNAFGGTLRQQDGRFLSTKTNGSGIGLSSVLNIAKKYDGIAEFSADGDVFLSKVMLRLSGGVPAPSNDEGAA